MPTTYQYVLEVPPPGRDVSEEGWEDIIPAHIEALRSAPRLLNRRTIDLGRRAATFRLDWTRLIHSYRRHFRVMQEIDGFRQQPKGMPAYLDILRKFPQRGTRITIEITVSGRAKRNELPHERTAAVESFLHDVFLIMNIAAPASCNFYISSLKSKDVARPVELSLSNVSFDITLLNGRAGKWPAPMIIEVSKVADWVFAVRKGVSQVPQSRMEKVLFALLHLAKTDISPTVIVWLFYALETLFDTRPGENRRSMQERAKLLLLPNEKEAAILGRNLRELYEYRSKLVHGGLEVIHPMHNEQLDARVDDKYREFARVSEFGFALVLVSVQAVIKRGWLEPQFAEVLGGVPLNIPSDTVAPKP
jgi:hypothetical protein